jgi:hypothetical protein
MIRRSFKGLIGPQSTVPTLRRPLAGDHVRGIVQQVINKRDLV